MSTRPGFRTVRQLIDLAERAEWRPREERFLDALRALDVGGEGVALGRLRDLTGLSYDVLAAVRERLLADRTVEVVRGRVRVSQRKVT